MVALTQNVPTEAELLRRQRSAASRRGQIVTQERRDKISATLKRRYATGEIKSVVSGRTPEWRQKISKGLVTAYREGRIDPTGCYKNKWQTYQGINMRSKSEALFAQHLDNLDIQWDYEPERFDLDWCTYTPDFYLSDFDHWIEVKGYWTEISRRKFDEFRLIKSASVVMARNILRGDCTWSLL